MPTVNLYLSEKEYAWLLERSKQASIRVPLYIRHLIREKIDEEKGEV